MNFTERDKFLLLEYFTYPVRTEHCQLCCADTVRYCNFNVEQLLSRWGCRMAFRAFVLIQMVGKTIYEL